MYSRGDIALHSDDFTGDAEVFAHQGLKNVTLKDVLLSKTKKRKEERMQNEYVNNTLVREDDIQDVLSSDLMQNVGWKELALLRCLEQQVGHDKNPDDIWYVVSASQFMEWIPMTSDRDIAFTYLCEASDYLHNIWIIFEGPANIKPSKYRAIEMKAMNQESKTVKIWLSKPVNDLLLEIAGKQYSIAEKERHLRVLKELERIRRLAEECPQQYPIDHGIRLCEAVVAEHFGYTSRVSWTEALAGQLPIT